MLTHASVRLRALLVAGHRPVSTDPTRRADLESLFLDRRVRYLLRHLTSYDPIKVFTRKSLDNLQSPKYRFMTDEQLQEVSGLFWFDKHIFNVFHLGIQQSRGESHRIVANAAGEICTRNQARGA